MIPTIPQPGAYGGNEVDCDPTEEGVSEQLLRLNRVKVEIRPRTSWRRPSVGWLAVNALAVVLGAALAWVVMKWL